ncbi:MAG: hypothetical protein DRN64_03385 [Thaumarchaeota archaeon]|nr:MAG: hypothetical protein DRN64_03385 [Nitrososphaerota archaeon]
MSGEELKVTIRYGDLEAEFSGSPEAVYRQVVSFLEKAIPEYSLAKKISFSMDLKDLLEVFGDYFAYDEREGLFFKKSLSDLRSVSDAILFLALRRHLEYRLGRVESPAISSAEFESSLQAKKKTILNNLTKLVQSELLKRLDRGDYAITPLGIKHLADKFAAREA